MDVKTQEILQFYVIRIKIETYYTSTTMKKKDGYWNNVISIDVAKEQKREFN